MGYSMKNKMIILSIVAALLVAMLIWIVWENSALELNTITVTGENLPKAFAGYKIAQISDLHNDNANVGEKLIGLLRDAKPDIIVITGDMIDSGNPNVEITLQIAKEAVKIAPCYYVTGNHEAIANETYAKLEQGLREAGVIVLRDEAVFLEKNGATIQLIGLDDLGFSPVNDRIDEATVNMEQTLRKLATDDQTYTVLLAHRPELIDVYVAANVDLVLGGHAHGGQFRIPFIGGVYAPGQGFFPEYDSGLYAEGKTQMVVSRGIGNSIIPLRVNNRPEVVLVELQCS